MVFKIFLLAKSENTNSGTNTEFSLPYNLASGTGSPFRKAKFPYFRAFISKSRITINSNHEISED
ncbi:MAG: hypothetical protein C0490_09660 [Marivirga sp.]|nr:hypothetical protein [Marivirga sp.]